jgi:hypothetical protein
VKHRGRVYWRRSDLPALEAAHAKFAGRSVFERDRKHEKARAQRQALTPKAKPRRIKAKQNDVRQIDLFSDDARTTGEDGQSRS